MSLDTGSSILRSFAPADDIPSRECYIDDDDLYSSGHISEFSFVDGTIRNHKYCLLSVSSRTRNKRLQPKKEVLDRASLARYQLDWWSVTGQKKMIFLCFFIAKINCYAIIVGHIQTAKSLGDKRKVLMNAPHRRCVIIN